MMDLAFVILTIFDASAHAADSRLWDLVPAVVGGVLGALAGGLPAYFLAVRASSETVARDIEVRTNDDITLLYSAAQKLMEIMNGLYSMCLQFNDQLDAAACAGHRDMDLQAILVPLLGMGSEEIKFASTEIALFFRLNETKLGNDLLLISRRFNTDMIAVRDYSTRREAFAANLTPKSLKDGIGTIELTGEAAARAAATVHALNETADQMLKSLHNDRRHATTLIEEFSAAARRMFPHRTVPGMTFG